MQDPVMCVCHAGLSSDDRYPIPRVTGVLATEEAMRDMGRNMGCHLTGCRYWMAHLLGGPSFFGERVAFGFNSDRGDENQ